MTTTDSSDHGLEITPAHASAALRWLDSMRAPTEWHLSNDEMAILLGNISLTTLQIWLAAALNHEDVELPVEILVRVGVLLGIYRTLKLMAPPDHRLMAQRWFSTPLEQEPFDGLSIRGYLLRQPAIKGWTDVQKAFCRTTA